MEYKENVKLFKKRIGIIIAVLLVLNSAVIVSGFQDTLPTHREISLTARQYTYEPHRIEVNRGDNVTLKIKSIDVVHGMYIDGYDIKVQGLPGQIVTINFIADKVGKFRFRCSVICGSSHPFMIGELVVKPNYVYMGSIAMTLPLSIAFLFIAYMYLEVKKEDD